MNEIAIFNETTEEIKELKDIETVILKAIEMQKLDPVEFSIIIVDNQKIHDLNKTWRHVDRETDVITFALEDEKNMVLVGNRVLGDIYISIDKAKEQAKEYGHSLKRELCFLAVHGFLHLLGYDHMSKEEEEEMFGLQKEILHACNIER